MNQKQLFDQALSLPLADRAALAEQLLASLDQPIRK
ncbi:MAG: addiction module protein [Methylobacter tundripaludum]|nr:addiction module protein [Methylobacter tundripaludum]